MTNPNVPVDGAKREQAPAQAVQQPAVQPQPAQQMKATSDVAQSPNNETKTISSPDAAKALSSTTPAGETKSQAADQSKVDEAKKMAASQEEKSEDVAKRLKDERQAEQSDIEKLEQAHVEANEKNNLFIKIAEENKVYADQSRDEHRMMRLREDEEKLGDPTRDAAAKQAVMDQNTPQEGALEDAAKMSQGKK